MQIDEILIINNDNIRYGIATRDIEQILRVPELTPLALSPEQVAGLCAVGGNIVTVMDFNRLLGMGSVEKSAQKSRLLTLAGGYSHAGLLVSEVLDTVLVDEEEIDYIDAPEDAVCAICKSGDDIVQVLDVRRMLEVISLEQYPSREIREGSSTAEEDEKLARQTYERYLLFKMQRERYAVSIDFLREIIALPESFTEVSGSNKEVRGMMSLRDELLTVADLRTYYGFEANSGEANRILVVQNGDKTLGLIIDEIIDIRDYGHQQITQVSDGFQDQKSSGVIHDKERLVSLVAKNVLQDLFRRNEKFIIKHDEENVKAESGRVMEVVVFKLGEQEYAINIEDVAEIIDTMPVTSMAGSPDMLEGVINIRGQVVPIGSLHKRLGISEGDRADQKIVVCRAGKNRIGFFVGSVSDVMDVRSDELRKEEKESELFSHILHFNGGERLVMLFDMGILLGGKAAA